MSELSQAFRTLGAALHEEAEKRFPREGRVAPPRSPGYEDKPTALVLGSLAQALEVAADRLETDK